MDEDNSGDISKAEAVKFLKGYQLGNALKFLLNPSQVADTPAIVREAPTERVSGREGVNKAKSQAAAAKADTKSVVQEESKAPPAREEEEKKGEVKQVPVESLKSASPLEQKR